jgi:hypothetical protein
MKKIKLKIGEVEIYNLGAVKLHAYKTNDFMNDEVFLLEKNGKVVLIESPDFYDNNLELEDYIKGLGVTVDGILVAYHSTGGTILKGVKRYSTKEAENFAKKGYGGVMVDSFTHAFGDSYDNHFHEITNYIKTPTIEIAGIKMKVIKTEEAFNLEIPEINATYIHMLGADVHSIVGGAKKANEIIANLTDLKNKDFKLILTSHHTPEGPKAVDIKIAYLEDLKKTAKQCSTAQEMKSKIKAKYPNYSGENYLDMTTEAFFGK